jgi:hypothetical protein
MADHDGGSQIVTETTCPSCRYELAGMQTYSHAADPDRAGVVRCSECGGIRTWVEIARFWKHWPAWSFAHGQRVSPLRWCRTFLRVLSLRWFWSDIARSRGGKAARWLIFAASCLIAGHAALSLALVCVQVWNRRHTQDLPSILHNRDGNNLLLNPYGSIDIWKSPNAFATIDIWTLCLPGISAMSAPVLVMGIARTLSVLPSPTHANSPDVRTVRGWMAAWAGSIELGMVWAVGLVSIFALAAIFGSAATGMPSMTVEGAMVSWLILGVLAIAWWWYGFARTRAGLGRSVILAILVAAGVVGGFMGMIFLASSLGFVV